ncbi:MAG: CPXCG motif-containing cysteine-rich protein [Gammaproteobacteria bacterium]|nr:CPXCG motif-containing cysteine-rich protein [Gammaproteobacteria bacterium]
MNALEARNIQCPYCGESINILIDCSIPEQSYIEDCPVCCRPINLNTSINQDGKLSLIITHENE